MNSAIPFIWVPILAVTCYGLLIIALLSAEKNKVIRSFIYLLFCFLAWTGGSMLMRLQMFPGYEFWYEVSILALFAAPFLVYNFLYMFIGARGNFIRSILLAATMVMLVLTHFEIFLKVPDLVTLPGGKQAFIYETTWMIAIPTLIIIVILATGVMMVVTSIKKLEVPISSLMPIFFGLPVLVVGNVASVIPGNLFPFDTLSGIINASLMFYALYRNRLFRMTLLVSRAVVLTEAMILGTIVGVYQVNRMEDILQHYFPQFQEYYTLVIAVLFALFIILSYRILNRFLNSMFLKVEQLQSQRLKEFSVGVSQSIDLNDITRLLMTFITDSLGVQKVYVCLNNKEEKAFTVTEISNPLESKNFNIAWDHPCVVWMKQNKNCLIWKEFKKTAPYKSLHDGEKQLFSRLGITCLVPLISGEDMIGLVLLGERQKSDVYSYDDITLLESAQAIASVAVNNASLYEKARRDADTDSLTGVLNRKAFIEALEKEVERCRNTSLTLLLLNLDNFKLFNQLYGSLKGDMALKNVAEIIECTAGRGATIGRYGGKEFAICLPDYDIRKAVLLAENLQLQVRRMGGVASGITLKTLTMSGGICSMPYGASTLKELLENADMAVYNAKRSGKDKICVYTAGSQVVSENENTYPSITAGGYKDYAATIYALTAAIDAKDHYTFNHSQNVESYATELAKAAGINPDHIQIIREAALLHDIGKIAIPEHLLSKQGKLTAEEYDILKSHVEHSISIIRHLPSLDYVIPSVVAHHERWDGRGYPRGINRNEIPIGGRCLAIADSFDAMISERSYKPAFTTEFACNEILAQAAKQFDPQLAVLFVNMVRDKAIAVNGGQEQSRY